MLYWTGDYPAQAKASGTHDKMCHWCRYKSDPAPEANRRAWGGYRRYLPANHHMRRASARLGPQETGATPARRSHGEYVADAAANEEHVEALRDPDARRNGVFQKDLPYKVSGVKEQCAFRFLPLFDMVWDFLPDMMHIILGVWKRHLMALLQGQRTPATPKPRKSWSRRQNDELAQEHARCKGQLQSWALSDQQGARIDARSLALAGDASWYRSNVLPFTFNSTMKAHDWMQVS